MNKQELVKSVYGKMDGLPLKQAENAVNAVLESIKETLAGGDEVMLVGFGSFSVREQKARTARNPKTGEKIKYQPKKSHRLKWAKA